MNKEKREIIVKLKERRKESEKHISRDFWYNQPFDILIHAVLNTIPFVELCRDFISEERVDLRASIQSNLEKRIFECKNPKKLFKELSNKIKETEKYSKVQRIRKIMELLLSLLDISSKTSFFELFYYTQYRNNKKVALKYLKFIDLSQRKKDLASHLLADFLESGDTVFLKSLLETEEYLNLVADNITEIWGKCNYLFIKRWLIEVLPESSIDQFQFLERENPELFLLAQVKNHNTDLTKLIDGLDKLADEKRHFMILNYSKHLSFDQIKSQLSPYLEGEITWLKNKSKLSSY